MARRTFTYNAYESGLTGILNPAVTSVVVDSALGLVAPVYLVIDPDVPLKREWVRVNTINANTLENMVRNLAGSVGDIEHEAGAKIRAVFSMQHLDDLFLDLEDGVSDLDTHINDTGDPHAAALYLKLAQANNLYVDLTGDTMTGPLLLNADPVDPLGAATKVYVDDAIGALPPVFSGLHADLTDLPNPSAHHTRYTDNEAQLAMGPNSIINPFHHNRYEDTDAVIAMGLLGDGNPLNHNIFDPGAVGDGNPLNHNRYTDGEAVAAVHVKYTDGEAVSAVLAADDYLRKAGGGSFTGELIGPPGLANNPAFAVGNAQTGMYQDGAYIGLTRNGAAVIVGDGIDELYMSGIVPGVGDDIVATSTQLFRVVSSRKYKKVGDIIDKAALRAKLMALPIYEWAYKGSDDEQIGWMAEDVAEVDARLVNWNDEGEPTSIRTLAVLAIVG